jgi:glycosyltransferase involved in cell wall biosynthesis
MRILMAAPLLPHPAATAGGALVIYGELEALTPRHEVTLISFAGASPADREGLDALARLGVTVLPVWRAPGTPLRTTRRRLTLGARWLASREPLRALKFYDARVQEAIDHESSRKQFDLVHVEDNSMGQYRYPSGVRSVLSEQDVQPPGSTGGLEVARWGAYQTQVWAAFDRIQVYTERDAASIRSRAPALAGRVRVNPFGVSPAPAADPAQEQDGEVLFLGGFHHPPNVDAALWLATEILPAIWRTHGKTHLTIAGADPPQSVRALAGDRVSVTGFVPDLEPLFARAAVVVTPLRTGSGMRVKLLQAMSRGKAVVTTPLGQEGLAPGAPLEIGGSAPELARAVTRLLDDPATRRDLGRRARTFVAEHHSWSGFAARLAGIYRELGLEP